MTPNVRNPWAAGLLTVIWLISGCAGVNRRVEPPKMHFAGIQLKEISGLESTFQVDLRVINGNPMPLAIEGITCDLTVNERRFASGVSGENSKIAAYGTAVVSITLYSSILDVFKGVLTMEKEDTVEYILAGKVQLGGGVRPSTIPFKISGTLDAATLQ